MQSSPATASNSGQASRVVHGRSAEDLVYQAMTAAAIFVTLLSVWLF